MTVILPAACRGKYAISGRPDSRTSHSRRKRSKSVLVPPPRSHRQPSYAVPLRPMAALPQARATMQRLSPFPAPAPQGIGSQVDEDRPRGSGLRHPPGLKASHETDCILRAKEENRRTVGRDVRNTTLLHWENLGESLTREHLMLIAAESEHVDSCGKRVLGAEGASAAR